LSSGKKVTIQNLSAKGSSLLINPCASQLYDFLLMTLIMEFFQSLNIFFVHTRRPDLRSTKKIMPSNPPWLIEQEKVNKQLSDEPKEVKRIFALAQAANLDIEKKVAELAEALKRCQDEKKATEEALDRSKKDLEKLQKTHDDDLRLIENLHKDPNKSLKTAEDLCTNNADLAKSLSSKE
jgi:septal ring factor EnvC (AmiA/AmiB activator)